MITQTIISSLVTNEQYTRKVIPYLKREYFREIGEQVVFTLIRDYFNKYTNPPTKNALGVELENLVLKEQFFEQAKGIIDNIRAEPTDLDWLVDTTENFCKQRAFYNAMLESSNLLDQDDTSQYVKAMEAMESALSVSFDSSIGEDFFEDAEERFDRYRKKQDQLMCGISIFDKTTKGGYVNKSLTVFMAPTGVGKSLFLCNFAAAFIKQGKNVLYITLEMSEDQVSERIELNALDVTVEQHKHLTKTGYLNRIKAIKGNIHGKLIVKEFPAHSAHSGHFRHLITELELKKKFKPDVIIVDYLGICGSARVRPTDGLYNHDKSIAEELRGLGQEFSCRVFTAVQVNRDGAKTSDFDMTNTSSSWGVPMTADYFYGLIETEELIEMNQMKVTRLKDRYNDYKSWYPAFLVGVDKSKQRVYDLDEVVSDNLIPDEEQPIEDPAMFEFFK